MVPTDRLFALLTDAVRVTFSRPYDREASRLTVVAVTGMKFPYQARRYTHDKVFHTSVWDLRDFVAKQLPLWREVHIFGSREYSALLAKGNVISIKDLGAGNMVAVPHNRAKQYIIAEGEDVPIFVKLGIFTADGRVVRTKQDKFRQINRYMELLSDVLADYREGDAIEVVDYGCGKSYLSFGVYYYLTRKKGLRTHLIGVDRKADVMADCNALARQYGYDGMEFVADDIRRYVVSGADLVISLHACDTATDLVLYNAITQGTAHIFAAPCCQHEWNDQMDVHWMPTLNRHGILRERFAALLTDATRVLLLELCGYKVDIVEFVDLSDSPKNLLIRANRLPEGAKRDVEAKRRELAELLAQSGARPTLYRMLAANPTYGDLLPPLTD